MPFPSIRGARQRPRSEGEAPLPLDDDVVRRVYQLMYRHVGNREEAQTLTERTFERAASSVSVTDHQRDGEEVLMRMARMTLTEHLRAVYHVSTPRLRGDDLVGRLLARLPERERELLTQRFLRGASLDETASALQISPREALVMQWSALTHASQLADEEPAIASLAAGAGPCEVSS